MRIGAFLLSFALGFGFLGCREAGGNVSAGFGSLGAPGASANRGLGLLIYNVYRTSLSKAGDTTGMHTLEGRKAEFIEAVNDIIPPTVSQNLYGTIQDLLPLIDDGTIPGMAEDAKEILVLLRNDDGVLEALVNLQDVSSEANAQDYTTLLSRLLAYPEFEPLLDGISQVIAENDGKDNFGQPNGERDLLTELFGLLSRLLKNLPDIQPSSGNSSEIVDVLLTLTEQRDGVALGAPAWCVRTDDVGDPIVRKGANGAFLLPFVDLNNDGQIDKVNGEPVDGNGALIDLPAFGTTGLRDADGKAVTAQGQEIYEYFDAKKTVLGAVLRLVGDLLRDDIHGDFLALADGLVDRTQSGAFSDDNPMTDLGYAGLEMLKGRPTHNMLKGMAALLESDPDLAEAIFADLGDMVSILRNTTVTQTTSSGTGSQLDTLVPLLDEALENNGHNESAVRALLSAFSSEQQRLGNLPQGFAIMMRYHNYGQQVLTGPGKKSSMELLLEMVYEADQCNNPLGGGTLAELYLDAIAGNAEILGININIQTMNLITQLLGQLICNGLTSQHISALKDFDNTGTLDAFTPIATVFSDRGETRLLTDIMVALHQSYASAMRPIEPALVDVLESGAIEKFFDAFAKMESVQVPGTNDVVADAVADALAVLVDDDATVVDRHGNSVDSLAHLLADAATDLFDRVSQRNLEDESERLLDFGLDVLTSTVTDAQGNRVLKNAWLLPLATAALEDAAAALPTNDAARIAEVESMQADLVDLMQSADLGLAVDVLLAIDGSSEAQKIYDAVTNLFTPQTSVAEDVYGALLPLLCSFLNTKSSADPNDVVKLLRFVGDVIDPARGLVTNLIDGVQKLLAQDDGKTVLGIIRSAFDKGPNGTDPAPLEVLLEIMDDVKQHSSLPGGGTLTVADLKAEIDEIIDFIEDDTHGLPVIFDQLTKRTY